ncbi:tyrosine-type recombinase/integrase [Pseudomonas sp.]|uniref:tyrosine-type recombinase/integrase n=1 Tax=Pseudomonas sp. TaxID=306 RepID=UPI00258FFC56|nr:tyrosine-type recombinase/integrase [Pseudomonas sp.]
MKARARPSGIYYYYFNGSKELPLGKDYVDAVRKWAELEAGNTSVAKTIAITFRQVAEKYTAKVIPTKAPRTQKDNLGELANLYKFFDDPPAPLDSIEPHHIAQYRDWRKVTRSTQEIALLSHIWNWAREQGYTKQPNPCVGVKRNRAKGRNVYVDDALFQRVYDQADQPTRDAMDLAFLAAQRPGDSLRFKETDIRDGALWVRQGKTGTPVRVEIVGQLAQVIERIKARKAATPGIRSLALVVNEKGQALTASALDGRFGKAREKAGIGTMEFQFRDLRAKAATETEDTAGMEQAQALLGHADAKMTSHYVRHRMGKLVKPTR